MIKVKCHKCAQTRKTSSQAWNARVEHDSNKVSMSRNEQGKWECAENYGCKRNNKTVKG